MKKIYFSAILVATSLLVANLNAQVNVLSGSNMETADEASWSSATLSSDASNSSTIEFGYTPGPSNGSEGAVKISVTNSGTNGVHRMIYQQVNLKKDHRYIFDFKVSNMGTPFNQGWIEAWGGSEPNSVDDYTATTPGAFYLGGFKWSGWATTCSTDEGAIGDEFDGATLQENRCANADGGFPTTDTISFTEDSTVFIGVKVGIWAMAADLAVVFDEISLTDIDSAGTVAVSNNSIALVNVFPNPASTSLTINGIVNIAQANILNVVGQLVATVSINNNSIDISKLQQGVYFIEMKDESNNRMVAKFIKN